MKIVFRILLLAVFFMCSDALSQQVSEINYEQGTNIEVQSGADVCATIINVAGTFSGGGTFCTGALPVTISSFTHSVKNNTVKLVWVTETETNNAGFGIERKETGDTAGWKSIGFVPGSGTTNSARTYTFEDKKLAPGEYCYRLKQTDYNGNYEYFTLHEQVVVSGPKNFSISQNYPNPSNPKAKIDYEIPSDSKVSIKIYDILGKEVHVLVNEYKKAGYYSVEFDGSNLSSGIYFYMIYASTGQDKYTKTMKMILVK